MQSTSRSVVDLSESEDERDARSDRSDSRSPRRDQRDPSDSEDSEHPAGPKSKASAVPSEADADQEEIDEITSDPTKARKFRVNAKTIMLTYPKSGDLKEAEVYNAINEKWPVKAYIIATEKHHDGTDHIHFYVEFVNKINVINVRAFDIREHHPNVRTVPKKHKSSVQHYVMKSGQFTSDKVDMFPDSRNFMKKKMDLDAWIRYKQDGENVPVRWPIRLPNGTLLERPKDETEKKRHWVIRGAPDMGKTTWMNRQFKGQKVWVRPAGPDVPFDDYNGEEVLLYDDVNVDQLRDELVMISTFYEIRVRVPGKTRFTCRYWPMNQLRTIIIICNDWPSWKGMPWAEARFNYLDLMHWIPDYQMLQALPEYSPMRPVQEVKVPETPPRIFSAGRVPNSQEQEREREKAERLSKAKAREFDASQSPARVPSALDSPVYDEFDGEESQDPYQ